MTKEEVLQKANDYCNEKGYTVETLTDEFKDKFADFFAKKYPDANADDELAAADLKFNLNTAFSAASRGITSKQQLLDTKEAEYKRQIAELTEKLGKRKPEGHEELKIPKEVQDQLAELKAFKDNEAKSKKFEKVVALAKEGIRTDLHKSFESFAKGIDVALDKDDAEQAKAMVARFQEIFRDSIGDIKPLAPRQKQQRDEDFVASLPKIKVG